MPCEAFGCRLRILKPVDTEAALASGNTTRPPLPQPWARVLPLLLGSGPSRFEATRQPSSGPTKAADLRPIPPTGIYAGRHHSASPKAVEAWSARGWTVCDMVFRCPCAPLPPAPRLHHACVRVHVHVCAVRARARARARVRCERACTCARACTRPVQNHARTDSRACARDPPCAADAKNQCEAQMKYRMERKEMRRPHQAVLPRMPVMPTVRGTTNQPVDVL